MTNQYFSQQQYNKATRQTLDQVVKAAFVYVYEGIKWLANFIGSMFKMYLGK